MKKIIQLAGFLLAGAIGLSSCDGAGNVNTNTARNVANTTVNTAVNAANAVANAITNTAVAITTPSAEDFLKAASQGGTAEVELGKIAASKAQNPEVKKYGQMMVDDHSKANTELKALAVTKKITLPADLGSHRSTIEDLKQLTGAAFDKAYVEAMLDDHEEDVAAFQKQADSASDPDIKAFAAKTLPVLKKHLDAVKAIQAKMK
jgi:putative membrane protein